MADIHGDPRDYPPMPQAPSSGSAPVPYGGADQQPEPPDYTADMGPMADAAAHVMAPAAGGILVESPQAHDIAAGVADAPYYPGPLSPIYVGGDPDPGGRDDVAPTVAESVANATGRWQEHEAYTHVQGSGSGDLIQFPPSPLDPGVGVGNTIPTGDFYDPPRDYGGAESKTPGYIGNEPPPGYQGKAL